MKNLIKILILIIFWTMPTFANDTVDEVIVNKSERKLYLKKGDETFREYKISLGSNPIGHKLKEGDGKTPEGKYEISGRNPKSAYHLSLRISYPNKKDQKRAQEQGVSAGGDIMIHGYPNHAPNKIFDYIHQHFDWTAGCIALTDQEIEEIWELVPNGTPIIINP